MELQRRALSSACGRVCAAALVILASCKSSPASPPGEGPVAATSAVAAPASPVAIPANPSCGKEEIVHGHGYAPAARDCLVSAYRAGKPAELVVVTYTIEGDPITYVLRVLGPAAVEVIKDSRDRFGAPGITRYTCATLERKDVADHPALALSGCTGAGAELLVP